jgi:hypothetical protein
MGLEPEERSANPKGAASDEPTGPPAAGRSERARWILTELLPAFAGLSVGASVYVAYGGAQQDGLGETLVLTDRVIIGGAIWLVTRSVLRRLFPRPPAA